MAIDETPAEVQQEYSLKLFGIKISLSVDADRKEQLQDAAGAAKQDDAGSNADGSCTSRGGEEDMGDASPNSKRKKFRRTLRQENASAGTTPAGKKKPEQPVACPRCQSMDTKFCYFNNYNVNQPRHFCKNCQRYWTAGGTLRNVPVGAGRRKSKHGAPRVQDSGGTAITPKTTRDDRVARSSSPASEGASVDSRSDESQASSSREDCGSSSITQESGRLHSGWPPIPAALCGNLDPSTAAAAANWATAGAAAMLLNPWGNMAAAAAKAIASGIGKRPREESASIQEGALWVPKSLRMDDPGESEGAASFLTSLACGAGNKVSEGSIAAGGMFKAFQGLKACENKEAGLEDAFDAGAAEKSRRSTHSDGVDGGGGGGVGDGGGGTVNNNPADTQECSTDPCQRDG